MKYFEFICILNLIQYKCDFTTALSIDATSSDTSTPLPESAVYSFLRSKLECLKSNNLSANEILTWYDRVLNPASRTGRVSTSDRIKVWPCIDLDDFLKFEVLPDGYTTTTTTKAPVTEAWTASSLRPSTTANPGISREEIFDCLKRHGWNEQRIQKWYDRVLNPVSRQPGRVTLYDQDMVHECIDADDFLMWGLSITTHSIDNDPTSPANQKVIFDCLKDKGWSEIRTRQWYNRVFNPALSRSGVSLFDQDLVRGCLDFRAPGLPPGNTQLQYDGRPPSG